MPKPVKPAALRTGSPATLAMLLRSGGGVHADQTRRRDPKAQRRQAKDECRAGAW